MRPTPMFSAKERGVTAGEFVAKKIKRRQHMPRCAKNIRAHMIQNKFFAVIRGKKNKNNNRFARQEKHTKKKDTPHKTKQQYGHIKQYLATQSHQIIHSNQAYSTKKKTHCCCCCCCCTVTLRSCVKNSLSYPTICAMPCTHSPSLFAGSTPTTYLSCGPPPASEADPPPPPL